MLPQSKLSTRVVPSAFLTPLRMSALVDYEWGGIMVQDPSKGLMYRMWTSLYESDVLTISNGIQRYVLLRLSGITYHSFAFDQNMQPAVVYTTEDAVYYRYFDTVTGVFVTIELDSGCEYPQVTLDEHRANQLEVSDLILSYVREDKLYYRLQRDRYLIEHFVQDAPRRRLTQAGMTRNYRFRWRLVHKIKGE